MNYWETLIWAIDPDTLDDKGMPTETSDILKYQGPHIPALTIEEAQHYLDANGLGYCRLTGDKVVYEVPTDEKGKPIWSKLTRFDNLN